VGLVRYRPLHTQALKKPQHTTLQKQSCNIRCRPGRLSDTGTLLVGALHTGRQLGKPHRGTPLPTLPPKSCLLLTVAALTICCTGPCLSPEPAALAVAAAMTAQPLSASAFHLLLLSTHLYPCSSHQCSFGTKPRGSVSAGMLTIAV
jgi:hypothetical protein